MTTTTRTALGVAGGVWIAALLAATHAAAPPQTPAPASAPGPASSAAATGAPQPAPAALIDYQRQVHPLFFDNCLECHSQEKRSGGLSLATYEDAIEGGRHGAAIRPGAGQASLLIQHLTGEKEPVMPKDALELAEADISLIRTWIDQGARATPTSPPAPPPWEAPLTLTKPPVPPAPAAWPAWSSPLDRLAAAYLAERGQPEPQLVSDAVFARRVHLDVWGLLPTPADLQAFLKDTRPDKRERLVRALLADDTKYAEHWISFWNDLLRNEEGVQYYSETASRKSITTWLLAALESNLPYDRFVSQLLNPDAADDPDGFLIGVNWRGEVSASQTPALQAAQNTAQVFLGLNLKCNSCHDSFISRWSLKDAYAMAAFFAPEPTLKLHRCEVALDEYATPAYLFPELDRRPPSDSLADRRATAAAIFTDPRNGRVPRTVVNRLWHRFFGRGIVDPPDEMDRRPWSPQVLDWLAADFVEHGYDLKHVIATILTSRAYQMPAVPRTGEPPRTYVFRGPEVRRLTAEQFTDAIGAITGEWRVYQPPAPPPAAAADGKSAPAGPPPGLHSRDWHVSATTLTRALGRPIRDQVVSTRDSQATTLQALELVNGEPLTNWLLRGARKMLGELPPPPRAVFQGRMASGVVTRTTNPDPSVAFDVDVSGATRLYLIVQDTGSTAIDKAEAVWADAELVGPSGPTPLTALRPADDAGIRTGTGPIAIAGSPATGVRVKTPSRLVYDIAGRGFTRFRGRAGLETHLLAMGESVQGRFLIFDTEPDMDRLVPTAPGAPLPAPPVLMAAGPVVDRVFWHALGRAPSADERRIAAGALRDGGRSGRPSAEGLADLLWAVMMKPEFQLIY